MIEPAALLLDSFRVDTAELVDMRARQVALVQPDGHAVSWRELFDADAGFHELFGRFSGNAAVLDTIRQQNRLRRLMEYESYPDAARVRAWSGEHVAVIDALLEDDRALASERMTLHLRNAMTPSADRMVRSDL
jgi:DNA-binding GntR family transcriptional regulator